MNLTSRLQRSCYVGFKNLNLFMVLVIGIMACLATDCMGQREFDHLIYETPGFLIASDVLPPELKMGRSYSVRGVTASTEDTKTLGFTHRFEITSRYGNFEAFCIDKVRIRAHEINAIAVLRDIKETMAFSEAIKKARKGPYEKAVYLIKDPVDTVKGVPEGGWRFITQSAETGEGGSADALTDFFKLKCRYAYELVVDVYSTNKELQKELNSVSLAGFTSGTGASLLVTKSGKSAKGLMLKDVSDLKIITRTPFLDEIDNLLLDNTQNSLKIVNREKLKQIVKENYVIEGFLNHDNYTPRNKTIIVHALAKMDGIKNRDIFLKQAILVDNEEVAFIYQRMAEMIYGYHKNVKPVVEIIPVRKMVANYTSDQTIIATLPIDNLYWSEPTDLFVSELLQLSKSEKRPVTQVIMGISGKATSLAKEVLTARGIMIQENM
ncbi:MAG: hypothetical protein K8F52_13075 [Candidatus Scalindua rubra]|uniref:Uncharacterized protein n=1 Tax=Candidatus Scalindua brodae TaxID=237368 RepID=A0A0B0ECQ5_9BACT|nr:MAG: hypothetical protein SCABRO_03839 [Candidatus Scalindua brodae]MBZ0109593.1 hypothetical protein [Candidatus Scalindua rubra]TWU33154.1 hypothetical protein S225a_16060 [Candidatus Brocadiaceae bacterium S225]